jgi:hypothetical protein
MPRNSSGVYSQPAGTAAVAGQVASSSAFNDLTTDIGDEITASLPRDGRAPMTAPLAFAAGSAALPSMTFDGDPNTGFYRAAADSIGLSLGGSLKVTYETDAVTLASGVALNFATAVQVASATTTDIGAAASNTVEITGTTTITGLGTAAAGVERWVTFAGALTLTHDGTSLILPGAANITTAAGDVAHFKSEGSGNWRCYAYHRAATVPFSGYASDATAQAMSSTDAALTPANLAALEFVAGDDGRRGLVPPSTDDDETASKVLGAGGAWVFSGAPHAVLQDQKSQGTSGGGVSAGSWVDRTLNTEVYDPGGIASLSSNIFTLGAGTYIIRWSAPATNVAYHQSRLFNSTDNADVAYGMGSHSEDNATTRATTTSDGIAFVSIADAKGFKIQHRVGAGGTLGDGCNFGTEVFTTVEIWKVT